MEKGVDIHYRLFTLASALSSLEIIDEKKRFPSVLNRRSRVKDGVGQGAGGKGHSPSGRGPRTLCGPAEKIGTRDRRSAENYGPARLKIRSRGGAGDLAGACADFVDAQSMSARAALIIFLLTAHSQKNIFHSSAYSPHFSPVNERI